MKCATSSIHYYLAQHPDVSVSEPKELDFFLSEEDFPAGVTPSAPTNWSKGLDWYASHFDPTKPVRGEASPNYTSPEHHGAAGRIHATLPDARLLFVVRDPFERAVSNWKHRATQGLETRPLADAILDPTSGYVRRSRYYFCLLPYLELFPSEQLRVVSSEALRDDRLGTLASVFTFLGLEDPGALPQFRHELNTAAGKGRLFHAVQKVKATRLGGAATELLPTSLVRRAKARMAPTRTPRADEATPVPSSESADGALRAQFGELVAEDQERFHEILPSLSHHG